MNYISPNIFLSQFQLMSNDLPILLKDWVCENNDEENVKNIVHNIVEGCIKNIVIILKQLRSINLESPPAKKIEGAKNIIDVSVLIELHEQLSNLINIIPDKKFIDRGKLPTQHFSEFLSMIDSLREEHLRYFFKANSK
ncbi:hypothetical protein [Acinetobacter brisouii]|uniref:hypothetical protein n=1 Tax=Acinetobacter brisouii TaxID=396323 RepID=UPI0012505460|nr:hypothetical protein [Acinetobacter brisouii]